MAFACERLRLQGLLCVKAGIVMRFILFATSIVSLFVSDLHAGSIREPKSTSPHVVGVMRFAQNRPDLISYDNYDLLGSDLRSLKNVDLKKCSAACQADGECQAFSFNKWDHQCTLKKTLTSRRFEPSSVSGVAVNASLPPEANLPWSMQRFLGKNFSNFSANAFRSENGASYEQCERVCEDDAECVALTYLNSQRTCKLFGTIGVPSDEQGIDSGIKHQTLLDETASSSQDANRQRLLKNLADAGDDLTALRRFLGECGGTCPLDLRTTAQSSIDLAVAVTDCDRLAASPSDPGRPAGLVGVEFDQIDAVHAIPACRVAVGLRPNNPRLVFELGRALNKIGGDANVESAERYRFAADAGNAAAMNNLANMYQSGRGVAKDEAEAFRWYLKAADAGVLTATVNLGVAYQHGFGVVRNAGEAVRFYRQAAEAGSAAGMNYLGVMYRDGDGVPKDPAEALRWFSRSADAGSSGGMTNLGIMYLNGSGVEKDPTKAVTWFRKAIDAGSPDGMNSLGTMYQNGTGVPKDYMQARLYYEKAAAMGQINAINNLGILYQNGWGVPKDYAQALQFYEKAAAAGQINSITNIGNLYQNGLGVPKSYAKARESFEKAAAAGEPVAMNNLGAYYQNGWGTPKNYALALQWFEKAVVAGQINAMTNLGVLYQNGLGVAKDYAKARQWYEKAAAAGEIIAMGNLGACYQNGWGGPKNHTLALRWTEMAAAGGNELAKKNLRVIKQLR